ncbi:MAG: carboxypeptidase-like regulatory domain-containing protein [Bacteroidota bacterium]
MDKILEGKHNTTNLIFSFVTYGPNVSIINTFNTMKNDVNIFKGKKVVIENTIMLTLGDFKGITKDQTKARGKLGKTLADTICIPSLRYARGIDDGDLIEIFKYTESQLKRWSLSSVIQLVDVIINKSEELLNVPAYVTSTEITTDNIDDARALRDVLSGLLGKAKLEKKNIGIALKKLESLFDDLWDNDLPNLLQDSAHFSSTYPEFVKGMAEVIKIDDLPTSHTGISGTLTDADGNPVIGATVVNLDMPDRKPMVSNNVGLYSDEIFKWGTYRYKFMHPDFKDKIITVSIGRGKKVVVDVVMVRK